MQFKRFKILFFSLVTSISFSIILSGCEPQVTAEQVILELVSQGITYQITDHLVYSAKNGVMDPALKDIMKAAKEIPFADDFTFMKVGPNGSEKVEKLSFNTFDENLENIRQNDDKLVIPSEAGLYYVAVLFSWGDSKNNSGYQYIFKTRRQ